MSKGKNFLNTVEKETETLAFEMLEKRYLTQKQYIKLSQIAKRLKKEYMLLKTKQHVDQLPLLKIIDSRLRFLNPQKQKQVSLEFYNQKIRHYTKEVDRLKNEDFAESKFIDEATAKVNKESLQKKIQLLEKEIKRTQNFRKLLKKTMGESTLNERF